jgi:hypothetical protein
VLTPVRRNHVFINCPFDNTYKPIFDAIVFAIYDLGFVARSSLEIDDGAEIVERYNRFVNDLPALCTALHRKPDDLTFGDLSETIEAWLQANR